MDSKKKMSALLCVAWSLKQKNTKYRIFHGFYTKGKFLKKIVAYIALFCGMLHVSYADQMAQATQNEETQEKVLAYLKNQKPLAEIQGSFIAWQTQCVKKNYQSCYLLARAYHDGYGVIPNAIQARKYAKRACQNGVVESCALLALVLAPQEMGAIDIVVLYRRACALDNKQACLDLKEALLQDIAQDSTTTQKEEVAVVLERICRLENDSTCYALQTFVAEMRGNKKQFLALEFERDLQECKKAEKEYSEDMRVCGEVGRKYAEGLGVASNVIEAERYFQLACKRHEEFCKHAVLFSILK